jgi:hypothetical protein
MIVPNPTLHKQASLSLGSYTQKQVDQRQQVSKAVVMVMLVTLLRLNR